MAMKSLSYKEDVRPLTAVMNWAAPTYSDLSVVRGSNKTVFRHFHALRFWVR